MLLLQSQTKRVNSPAWYNWTKSLQQRPTFCQNSRLERGLTHSPKHNESHHGWSLAEPKRLRFYEDAAKVVQKRMVLNLKKSFERVVQTARR